MTTFAVASNNNSTFAMSSEDGTNWTDRSLPGNTSYSGVTFCGASVNKYIAVNGNGGGTSQWATSADGHTWSTLTVALAGAQCVGWSEDLAIAVAWKDAATSGMAWSTDLASWTTVNNGACGSSSSSPGGHQICWSKELGLFVAAGNGTRTNQYATSTDGKVWTGNTSSSPNLTGIAWGGDGAGGGAQRFIAVGTGNVVRTSTIGTGSWTSETFATSPGNGNVDVAYGISINRFVVIGSNGTCNTREGGSATWTSRTISNHTWHSIVWSVALSLFVVVADDGSVATSPDGITWTDRTASSSHTWVAIAVGGSASFTGSIAQTLFAITEALSGNIGPSSAIAMTLFKISQAASGISGNLGTIAQTLKVIVQALFGNVPKPPGTGGVSSGWSSGP